MEDWATTGGKVMSARLDESQSGDTYKPIIEYAYTVNDTQYQGNNIFPGENASFKKDLAQKHPVNMYVPVRYNPKNSSESALEPQPHPTNFITLAGWVLTGFWICAFCFTVFMTFVIFGMAQ